MSQSDDTTTLTESEISKLMAAQVQGRGRSAEMLPVSPGAFEPGARASETICAEYRHPKSAHRAFSEQLGVAAEFLPFAGRSYNRLRLLWWTTRTIERAPPTRRYISRAHVREEMNDEGASLGNTASIPDGAFLLHGAYPTGGGAKRRTQYANPSYAHHDILDSVTDADERVEWAERYAALGFVPQRLIAPHFGVTSQTAVSSACQNHAFDWEAAQNEGRRRIQRTWAVCERWGYDPAVLAEAFGVTEQVVEAGIHERREAGFCGPPFDPSIPESAREWYSHADVDVRSAEAAAFETAVPLDR